MLFRFYFYSVLFSPIVKDVLLRFLFREMKTDSCCRRFIGGGAHSTLAIGGVEQKYQENQKKMGKIDKKTYLTTYKGKKNKNEKYKILKGNTLKYKSQNWG